MIRRAYSPSYFLSLKSGKKIGKVVQTAYPNFQGHGVPDDVSAASDGGIYIPISSKTESLNASVAAAIFMWEQTKIF